MHGASHGGSSHNAHSSDSFSSHSGFSSGSSGSSFNLGSNVPLPPRRFYFFGRPVFIANSFFSCIIPCLFFALVAIVVIIGGSVTLKDTNTQIRYMKEDAIEAAEIIDRAAANEDDEYYMITIPNINFIPDEGEFADGYTYEGYSYRTNDVWVVANYYLTYDGLDYYQLFYTFKSEDSTTITGLTHAQYSENQIMNFHVLEIAYKVSGNLVDSVNMDFDINKCMDHQQNLDDNRSAKTLVIVCSIILGAIVVGIALMIVFGIKKAKKDMALREIETQANAEKTQAETEAIRAETQKKNRVCPYCGSAIGEDDSACPGCGSKQIN